MTVRIRSLSVVLCFRKDGSFPNGKGYSFSGIASSHASSYFTGAIFADSSTIVQKGETVFANNTADYLGGKTGEMYKLIFDVIQVTGRFIFKKNILL